MTFTTDIGLMIRETRSRLGLSEKEFAFLVGLKDGAEKVGRWELNTLSPSESVLSRITNLPDNIPFRRDKNQKSKFKFIDLFAGIGGFRLPFQELGGECVFSSEWDRFSQTTYLANFGDLPAGDITKIITSEIPDHDVLLAGFPCQSFSQAGLKRGFLDTRGTLFFEIQKILAAKAPRAFVLENVKQLRGHNNGQTLNTILQVLRGELTGEIPDVIAMSAEAREALSVRLNYAVETRVLRAADFGLPQNRERVFLVGLNRDFFGNADFDELFTWPKGNRFPTKLGTILEDPETVPDKYTLSQRLWDGHIRRKNTHAAKGNGFGFSLFTRDSEYANTISARYYKDGSEILISQGDGKLPRKLTPRECARLQGFPDQFIVSMVSDGQVYRQFGNSVAVPVIREIGKRLMDSFNRPATLRDWKTEELEEFRLEAVAYR